MPGLSRKETARLLDYIEPQGVTVTNVKNGVMLRLPDGGTQVVHFSVSDHRGPQKLRARLRRAGVTWPTDAFKEENMPRLQTETRKIAEKAFKNLGYPTEVKPAQMRELFARMGMPSITNGTIRRVMFAYGYQPHGATMNLVWRKPVEFEDAPASNNVTEIFPHTMERPAARVAEKIHDVITQPDPEWDADARNLEAVPETEEEETLPATEDVPTLPATEDAGIPTEDVRPSTETDAELETQIYERAETMIVLAEENQRLRAEIARLRGDSPSWTIDLDGLPDGMTLVDLRLLWVASGLDVEIRLSPRK